MAWTTPVTWTADQLVKAVDMNAQIRDNMNILKFALDDNGKILAINSTYFSDLSGASLTGIARLNSDNTFTEKTSFTGAGRLVVPVGVDLWAT